MVINVLNIKRFVVPALCALLLVPVAVRCGTTDSDENNNNDNTAQQDAAVQQDAATGQDASGPTGHTEVLGGNFHMPGKEDPLSNCVSCHGASLGGGAGQSCYNCHNDNDHTISYGGQMHLSGTSSTCSACHGPSNSGGIGPACSDCH